MVTPSTVTCRSEREAVPMHFARYRSGLSERRIDL